ncbi:PorT family protein [bacterium]|nr:PorT family protein [bacterium]
MKRVGFTLLAIGILLMTLADTSSARVRKKTPLNWGVVVGYNLSNATGSWTDVDNYTRKWDTGLMAGITGAINLTNNFAIHSELLFGRRGYRLIGDDGQAVREFNPYMYYVEVPVFLEWDMMPKEYVRPHLFAGPSFGTLTGSGVGIDIPGKKNTGSREITNVNGVDLSFVAGIRMSFPAGRERGYLELRYLHGIRSFLGEEDYHKLFISDDFEAITLGGPGEPSARHQVITLAMGFMLDFNVKKPEPVRTVD